MLCFTMYINVQIQCSLGSLIEASLASHTLHREEGSGHTAIIELSARNAIIKQHG